MIRWAVDGHLLITFGPISSSQSDGYLCPVSHHIQPKPEAEGNARKLQQPAEILISIRRQAAIFFRRDTDSANATMRTIMPKTLLSLEELRSRAFEAIKQYDGCEGVSDVTICEIADDSAPSNWRIGAVGVSPGWASAATRAAVCVQDDLQHDFDLLTVL
jgi:hypothetical protein